ncbi:MAG: hypothetical protein QM784_06220 [Polyangiaceae bacterium]
MGQLDALSKGPQMAFPQKSHSSAQSKGDSPMEHQPSPQTGSQSARQLSGLSWGEEQMPSPQLTLPQSGEHPATVSRDQSQNPSPQNAQSDGHHDASPESQIPLQYFGHSHEQF